MGRGIYIERETKTETETETERQRKKGEKGRIREEGKWE